jgi:hypothetical protein
MATRNQLNPPPLRKITDFKSKLSGGGARANLFEVVLSFPDSAPTDSNVLDKSRFLIKTAALPASTIGPVNVPFRGRILKIAGDRTFESWTVTVINDTDFSIRSALENWINSINRVSDATGATDPAAYQADAFVYQLDRTGETLRAYHMYDIFPTNIAQIALSNETTDAIEEFTCEFQVQWWEAVKGTGTNAGGLDIN